MNSTMLAGERRWATARRGGMTVLGKVAVPKPLNLPSQRLENHGLDPNVEIVPKGTLSWGSRPSSSGSNPWKSSSLSPKAEGGTVSPSHISGRPSSGGSGTRPSTAGSDRTHEPVATAWGSNSRPASASGTLSSNQTSSTSLRPRSAENRPNSSQLSRFAEPVSKSAAAWGPSGTAERLGVKSSKEDGFSLSSGDFPTLGTEKDISMKVTELEDHGRPSSAAGRIAHGKEDTRSQADVKHGTVNTWRADGLPIAEDDIHPNIDKWHGDPQQYYNSNPAPQRFDAWCGPPPMNGPAGWYGGRPRGPPFGGPVGPGGFPMEPFPYYRHQIAPPPLAGSQQVPPQGHSRAPHPKNGDLYRAQMPDAFARPGMPYRPGFYPGPPGPPGPMAFEGYYGPPMGYERDIPYMGRPAGGPPVYNSYPVHAPDIGNSHGRVPLKNHNERDQRVEGETWEHNVHPDVPYPEKNRVPIIASRKNEWGAEVETEEAPMYDKRRMPNEKLPRNYEYSGHSADGVKVKSFEGMGNVKAVHDNWTSASESAPSYPSDMPRVLLASERDSSLPAVTKNSALMHKIDGLNAKMRGSDGRNDSQSAYNREEEKNGARRVDKKTSSSNLEGSNAAGSFERTPVSRDFVSAPHEVIVPVTDKPKQPLTVMHRKPNHGGQGRVDHRGKGKFNSQDTDGWRKRPLTSESSSAVTASHIESAPSTHAHNSNIAEDASENSEINLVGKIEGDSVDIQAQRAKMRETAKQRALQLQKEEEERIREQKAKALAKLEELNRRTLAGEGANEKTQVTNDIPGEQEESCAVGELVIADLNNANQAGESVDMSRNLPVETQQTGLWESDVSSWPVDEDARDGSVRKLATSQFNDGGATRNKRTGYKQKQNNSSQKSFAEKSAFNVAPEAPKGVATNDITSHEHPSAEIKPSESNMRNTSDNVVEPSAHQRRKGNRGSKNKHKLDETPVVPSLPPVIVSDINSGKESVENIEAKDSWSRWDTSFSTEIEPDKDVQQTQEVISSLPNEESQNKVSNQWKPHPSRRLPRNQQANNNKLHGGDTAVWAPVRTLNKAKGSVEVSPESVQESTNSTKGNNLVQNSLKGKRAEMERYVPKPVAKELAQHGNAPPLSSSITSAKSNDESSVEVNDGDNSGHNKHKKDHHGTWRQRGSTDSSHMKSSAPSGPSRTTELTKEIEVIGQSVKSEINLVNAENNTTSKYPPVKDQGTTGRGKRNAPKVNNPEPEKTFSGEVETDRTIGSKENRTSSHWQPKSNSNAANNNQQGNRTESLTTEINRFPKEHSQHKMQGGNFNQSQSGQYVNVKNYVPQEPTVGHRQEFEKKAKGRPYSPNQEPIGSSELPPNSNTDDHQLDRNFSSGSRRNFRRSGHDNRPHNAPAFRDNRHRQNLHYEYQPVGPAKGNKPEKLDEPGDGAENTDQRHRERGPSQSRRGGNSYRRQSGTPARVDSGWE